MLKTEKWLKVKIEFLAELNRVQSLVSSVKNKIKQECGQDCRDIYFYCCGKVVYLDNSFSLKVEEHWPDNLELYEKAIERLKTYNFENVLFSLENTI